MGKIDDSWAKFVKTIANIDFTNKDEWIWVEGYKGTEADMTCRGYQFELDKQYDIPEDQEIKDCDCGFHFCRDLKDVFDYYYIGQNHRFFKVKGLVRKKDYEEYGKISTNNADIYSVGFCLLRDKLAARSIIFTRELTLEEIIEEQEAIKSRPDWTYDDWKMAVEIGIKGVQTEKTICKLMRYGYSETFARYICKCDRAVKVAEAVGSQQNVSMDVKVLTIMNSINND